MNAPNLDFMRKFNWLPNITKTVSPPSVKKLFCRNMFTSLLSENKQIGTKNWRQHKETYLIDIFFIFNAVFIIKSAIQSTVACKKWNLFLKLLLHSLCSKILSEKSSLTSVFARLKNGCPYRNSCFSSMNKIYIFGNGKKRSFF